MRMSTFQ